MIILHLQLNESWNGENGGWKGAELHVLQVEQPVQICMIHVLHKSKNSRTALLGHFRRGIFETMTSSDSN